MPFADGACSIARRLQNMRDGEIILFDVQRVLDWDEFTILGFSSVRIAHRVNAVSRRVLTGKTTGATGRAVGRWRVGIGENHALGCQLVDVRRFIIVTALKFQVDPSEIVDVDVDDVWFELVRFFQTNAPLKRECCRGEGRAF